ncbi:hypothetical protein NHX12_004649 [Muraenolepis orangiensis]|uniref:Uncharacterized protein n=1 Tax=Muraenolepis orangiensis TaxID=630683 RepID=A0A9Q0IEI1_9TELE|nr:hypothetical protein NHX12_004649 [Muraenolepis orangiensis]
MAALTSISIEEDQFSCPVCLEVLRDPVTIPCGHSYCWDCIEDYWNRTEHRGSVCCPQCRQLFNPRPALSRNTVLWGVHSESHPVGVHREPLRGKAASSSPPRPTRDPRCPHHEHQALREYCWTDRQCVCARCVTGKHWGHDTGPLGEARAAHQRKLADASFKSIRKSKEIKKELRYIVRYIKHSTQAAMDESERTFSKLSRSIEKHRSEVQDLIRGHEQTALRQADQLLGQVEREGREMERRDTELEKLSSTEDDVQFLQKCKFLHFTTKTVDLPSTDVLPYQMYKSMKGALVELRETLAEMCESELLRVSDKEEKDVDLLHSSEPRVRDDFLQYYNDLSLDANTANPYLILSTGRRGVTTWSEPQPYPEHPARFTRLCTVK